MFNTNYLKQKEILVDFEPRPDMQCGFINKILCCTCHLT